MCIASNFVNSSQVPETPAGRDLGTQSASSAWVQAIKKRLSHPLTWHFIKMPHPSRDFLSCRSPHRTWSGSTQCRSPQRWMITLPGWMSSPFAHKTMWGRIAILLTPPQDTCLSPVLLPLQPANVQTRQKPLSLVRSLANILRHSLSLFFSSSLQAALMIDY